MSVKIFDTMTTATPNFPLAYAEKINVKLQDGTEDNLQNLFDNKELGGGDSSTTITQQEYEALSEEQKLDGLYYTYDTKRIYKNGVQYGASDAEDIGYNNAESGIQATTVQGAIDKVVKTVEDDYAKTADIPTTLPANGGNANTVNNHTVKSDVPENAVFTDTIYDDTELNAKLNGKADKNAVLNSLEIVNGYTTAQIIPWSDGTHYRSYEDKSSQTYTDIVTNNGIALIARTENGKQTKSEEIATMDKLGGCSIIKGTTTLITNPSGAMNLAHGGNFDHCTVSIQPTNNSPYFFSYCPLSKNNTYIIVTNWKGEIVTNTEIEFDWVVIGW